MKTFCCPGPKKKLRKLRKSHLQIEKLTIGTGMKLKAVTSRRKLRNPRVKGQSTGRRRNSGKKGQRNQENVGVVLTVKAVLPIVTASMMTIPGVENEGARG